jgi:phage terminase large subunit
MAVNEIILTTSARWNPIFRPVNQCRSRYRVLKGSAGSGKSVDIAQDYIKKLSDIRYKGATLLVVRKTDDSNRDSTFAVLQAAIFNLFGDAWERVWTIRTAPLSLICKATGCRIIFRGMADDRQRERVKSIAAANGKICWIWIEEATELSEQDFDILDDRLRGELPNPNLFYQVTLTFNPVAATHWIKGRFFDIQNEDVFTHQSTYLDNRFCDAGYHRRMMARKERDPEGYRVYGLGEWGELGGLILTNYIVHEFETAPEYFDSTYIGQDFGFNHANAILPIGWKDGEIYIRSEIYVYEMDSNEIIKLANTKNLSKHDEMFCDSAEPDRISMWRKAGYRARAVVKDAGSVNAQIDFLKIRKIHIHPSCVNTIKEIGQWKWKKDQKTGLYIDQPVDIFDDAMAALRYSVERLRPHRGNGGEMINVMGV